MNGLTFTTHEAFVVGGTTFNFPGGIPIVTQTVRELRLYAETQPLPKLTLDASYYFANGDYHIQNPADPTGNTWIDSRFPYSAPRLGATWRVNQDFVIRGAAGGGFALPPLFDLIGTNSSPSCGVGSCTVSLTNTNLKPETSFGWDLGTDVRFQRNTILSGDVYRTNLYGQLFQAVNFVGLDPATKLPTYAQEYLNLAQSRFEGVNLAVRDDVSHGLYWNAGLGLTRGFIVSVPPGFYNEPGMVCNFATGNGCVNTYAIPGSNFNGQFESTVPYANGSGAVGFRWTEKKYLELQANYFGNNNAYFNRRSSNSTPAAAIR